MSNKKTIMLIVIVIYVILALINATICIVYENCFLTISGFLLGPFELIITVFLTLI